MSRRIWSREELIVAFNLYCKIPFGQNHIRNPKIIALAKIIGRSPSAVSWKLANFARLDPSLKSRSIQGATHGGKEEIAIWGEFNNDWEKLSFESEQLLAQMSGSNLEEIAEVDNREELPRLGKEREAVVRVRINQNFFRMAVLAAYDAKCCITGLSVPILLNASHIVPWALDHANRINPRNGLCLNAIHDRAFDRGLLTITPQYRVKISKALKFQPNDEAAKEFLLRYEGISIQLPHKFTPEPSFLEYHNQNVFKG